MTDLPRASVLVRWMPFTRRPAAPPDHTTSAPWTTGRHDPTQDRPAELHERHLGEMPFPDGAARERGEPVVGLAAPLIPAPPVPAPRAPDLGRVSPEPLLRRPPRRPRTEPRGAVVDGIEHRPPIDDEAGLGLSRLLRGRTGSRSMALFFAAVYLVILLQLIYSLMNR
jgi:hypothetical protein